MSAGVVIATSVVLESNSFRRQVCANIRKGTLTLHNSILPTVGFASLLVLLSIPGVTQRNPQLQTPQAPAPAPIPVKQVDLDTATPDPQIVEALKEISGDHIRAAIERLVDPVGWLFDPDPPNLDRYIKDLLQSRLLRMVSALFIVWVRGAA